jgi:hypothetical protein
VQGVHRLHRARDPSIARRTSPPTSATCSSSPPGRPSGPLGLGRQASGTAVRGGSLGDAPWDFAPGAADQLWAIANTVSTWARHLAETRKIPGPVAQRGRGPIPDRSPSTATGPLDHVRRMFTPSPDQPIRTVIDWLLDNLDAIRLDEAAARSTRNSPGCTPRTNLDLRPWPTRCSPATATPPRSASSSAPGSTRPARRTPSSRSPPAAASRCTAGKARHVRCTACGTRYPLQPRLDEIRDRQINDQLARAHTIADALTTLEEPLGRDLLRKWIQRDALRAPAPEGPACETCKHPTCKAIRRPPILAQGVDDEGQPLYRFGDVRRRLQLVQEQRGIRLSA